MKSRPWSEAAVEAVAATRGTVLAAELSRLNADLAKSNAELDSFAHVVSHDLKEPLRGLRSSMHYVRVDHAEGLGEDGVGRLRSLDRLAERMESMIDSLLAFSEMGRSELPRERVDVAGLAAEVAGWLGLGRPGGGPEFRLVGDIPPADCNRDGVGEVLQNLFSNAVKYNESVPKIIEVGFTGSGAYWVRDNGIGIAEKHRRVIFDFFKRLHGRTKYGGGTGAGLAIAKRIVAKHRGEIWVDSTPGGGSTFYFTLGPAGAS